MNDLLKRIDGFETWDGRVVDILSDCRAEIERLEKQNFSMGMQTAQDICTIEAYEARIAELEKPYMPISNAEIGSLYAGLDLDNVNKDRFYVERSIEAEVIKRYNEQRSVK